jgi:hypothetical protein
MVQNIWSIDGGWFKIYRRNEMPEHYTIQDMLIPLVQRFVGEKNVTPRRNER